MYAQRLENTLEAESTETTNSSSSHGIFTKIGEQTDKLVDSVRNGAKKAKRNHDLKKRVNRLEKLMTELGLDLDE